MRFAICNELFGDNAEDSLAAIASAGYEGVELAPYTLGKPAEEVSQEERRRIRSTAADSGLVLTGLHWLLARTEGLHVSSNDPQTRARTLSRLNALSRLCADLGGTYLVFGSPAQRSTPEGMSRAEARANAVDLFRAWGETAAQDGTVVCLEGLPGDETDFMNTTADVIDVVAEVDSPAVRMVLDVKSLSAERKPIPDLIRSAAQHVAYVQANDANRQGPGFGDTDFVPIFQALGSIGYDGFVSVEAFEAPTGIEDMAVRSLAYLRSTSAQASA